MGTNPDAIEDNNEHEVRQPRLWLAKFWLLRSRNSVALNESLVSWGRDSAISGGWLACDVGMCRSKAARMSAISVRNPEALLDRLRNRSLAWASNCSRAEACCRSSEAS